MPSQTLFPAATTFETCWPPSPHRLVASRAKLLLGEGPQVVTATSRANPEAGTPPEVIGTIAKCHSNYLAIASSLPIDSTSAREKNEFLSSSRPRRKKPHRTWWSIA
jgi:hypothetical protein